MTAAIRTKGLVDIQEGWLATTLMAIAGGHMQSNIADLMPWNYAAKV